MASGDIQQVVSGTFGPNGSVRYVAATNSGTVINPGEPVARALGAVSVTAAATNTPVVG